MHCHAGRGRTALVICCYLIYEKNFSAENAIKMFKEKRTGPSITSYKQKKTIHKFEKCRVVLDRVD